MMPAAIPPTRAVEPDHGGASWAAAASVTAPGLLGKAIDDGVPRELENARVGARSLIVGLCDERPGARVTVAAAGVLSRVGAAEREGEGGSELVVSLGRSASVRIAKPGREGSGSKGSGRGLFDQSEAGEAART